MYDAFLECDCGHLMKVSSFAVGSKGRCPGCKQVLTVTEDNTRPITDDTPLPGTVGDRDENACGRCGKTFRGDWDRVETVEGLVCHHCSVRVSEGEQAKQPEPSIASLPTSSAAPTVRPIDWIERPDPSPVSKPEKRSFGGINTESQGFRLAVGIVAFGTVALTIALVATGGLNYEATGPTESTPELDLPDWAPLALYIWDYVCIFLAGWVAVYIVLRGTKSLPHNRFSADIIVVTVALMATTAMHIALYEASGIIAVLPIAGGIYGALLGFTRIVLAYFILDWFFRYPLKDFIITAMIYKLAFIVLGVLTMLIAGGLFNALT